MCGPRGWTWNAALQRRRRDVCRSGPTRVLLRAFHNLFRLNLRTGGLGWQMVAVGTVNSAPSANADVNVAIAAAPTLAEFPSSTS
jgi:hypothetical protein